MLATLALIIVMGMPDCAAFGPTDTPENKVETMEICQAWWADNIDLPVPLPEPVPLSWTLYALGLLDGSYATYEVQDGDLSLWEIAQKRGIPFGALLDANPGDPDMIHVGDVINLP